MSSRRGRSVGGQSSLGYLFGSDNEKTRAPSHDPPRTLINFPPYGTDHDVPVTARPAPTTTSPSLIFAPPYLSNNYHRAHGQNSGNFITDRPSTKVNSVPGGDSSLGYLFGDNK